MGRRANRKSKDTRDNSMLAEKQPTSESGVRLGLQVPRGTVKATLPELQLSIGDHSHPWVDRLLIPRHLVRGHDDVGRWRETSSEATLARWNISQRDWIRQRTEHLTRAITCNYHRPQDRLKGASPKATECSYYSANCENSSHEEGAQVTTVNQVWGGLQNAES